MCARILLTPRRGTAQSMQESLMKGRGMQHNHQSNHCSKHKPSSALACLLCSLQLQLCLLDCSWQLLSSTRHSSSKHASNLKTRCLQSTKTRCSPYLSHRSVEHCCPPETVLLSHTSSFVVCQQGKLPSKHPSFAHRRAERTPFSATNETLSPSVSGGQAGQAVSY